VYFNRALAYSGKTDYSHALLDLNRSIEINPNSPKAYMYRGDIYEYQKNYVNAEADHLKPMISKKHLDTEAQRNNKSSPDMNQNNNQSSGYHYSR